MRAMTWIAILALAAGAVLGQEQNKPESDPPKPPILPDPKPEVTAMPSVDPNQYVIGVEDILFIHIWRENEMSGPVVVRPDGKISVTLLGDVDAKGLTLQQLQQKLTDDLKQTLMKNPQVFVKLQAARSKKYCISGEVNRSGCFEMAVPIKILEALSNSGGLREFANSKKILILRGSERLKFNYKDVVKGKNMEQNIELKPGDHVIVP